MTHWVGITGGIGSGKSTATALFADHGVPVIDTDIIARELTVSHGAAIPALRQTFGDALIDDAGSLKRPEMRRLMLAHPTAKQQLEAVLHPLIREETYRQQTLFQAAYGLIAVPLLAESPYFQALVERVLVIDCPEDLQIARIIQRNGLSEAEAHALLAAQTTRAHRLSIADDVIENDADLIHLQQEVTRLHQFYTELFSDGTH
ncbi:MAG: dephospho-CoA kinase [Neisseria sp.]|nr:dephospho-CoA kinase [Neisseria sp.]